MSWLQLLLAIAVEVVATSLLPRIGFRRRPLLTLIVLGMYALAFLLIARAVLVIDVGVAYAMWSGLGTAVIAVVGIALLGEKASPRKLVALVLIVVGIAMLDLGGIQ